MMLRASIALYGMRDTVGNIIMAWQFGYAGGIVTGKTAPYALDGLHIVLGML